MANLKVTLACWDYDRTRALFDGRVKIEGVDLELWSTHNVGEIMERMVRDRQFEVSELGITTSTRESIRRAILRDAALANCSAMAMMPASGPKARCTMISASTPAAWSTTSAASNVRRLILHPA
jgi:hypothetical protein